MSAPVRYFALASTTIAVGLLVNRGAISVSERVRDPLGDALWAVMMMWLVSAAVPRQPLRTRAALALAISFGVEFSQLVRIPALDSLRATLPGHLVLGSGFDPRDLVAYAGGIVAAALPDPWAARN